MESTVTEPYLESPEYGVAEHPHQARVKRFTFEGSLCLTVEMPSLDLKLEDSYPGDQLPAGKVSSVLLAKERGQCGGVKAAVLGLTALTLEARERPTETSVLVNARPTNGTDSNVAFRRAGVKMDVSIDQVQPGDIVYVSAHGNPRYLKQAMERGAEVYDGTCIFVHSIHREIQTTAVDAQQDGVRAGIVYLSLEGRDNHPELIGSIDYAKDMGLEAVVIKSEEEAEALFGDESPLGDWDRLRIVSQTTNDADRAQALAETIVTKIADSKLAVDADYYEYKKSDVCRTVTDRQNAVRIMVQQGVGTLVVVGSLDSKNTINLVHVAETEAINLTKQGDRPFLERVILVNSHGQLPRDIKGNVGVVSGASTDDGNVDAVVEFLNCTTLKEVGDSDKARYGEGAFPPIPRTGNPDNQARLKELIERVQ